MPAITRETATAKLEELAAEYAVEHDIDDDYEAFKAVLADPANARLAAVYDGREPSRSTMRQTPNGPARLSVKGGAVHYTGHLGDVELDALETMTPAVKSSLEGQNFSLTRIESTSRDAYAKAGFTILDKMGDPAHGGGVFAVRAGR